MTKQQIDSLLSGFSDQDHPQLEESHISWIILSGDLAYKIKKPVRLHFLDFSGLTQRQFYCHRELTLNRRLTDDIYLSVLPVVHGTHGICIGHHPGKIIDYAVCMRRMQSGRRMDKLLQAGEVSFPDIDALAAKIALFHRSAKIVHDKDPGDIPGKFADLAGEEAFLNQHLPPGEFAPIRDAVRLSDDFARQHAGRLCQRTRSGFIRDCHGDLHTRNIFLVPEPQPFDCIEFNDSLREIDVLNEVAFLCMDLEAGGRDDLAGRFLASYNDAFPALITEEDGLLLLYFKSYRANVRAKIYSLAARAAVTSGERDAALREAGRYLRQMNAYLEKLKT